MDRIQRYEFRTLKIFTILAIVHMAIFGVLSYTVDSEIWSVNLAQYMGHPESYQFSVYNKPVFYLLLKLIYFLPLGDLETLIAAKTLFVVNGLVLTYLCFLVFRNFVESKEIAWAGLFFLLMNPTWVTECFRIRADLLAMTFSLLGLYWAIGKTLSPGFRRTALILLCFLVSTFCTLKSVVWNFPILLFLIVGGDLKVEKKRLPVLAGILLILMGILWASYATSSTVRQAVGVAWRHFSETLALYSFGNWTDFSMNWILVFNSIMAAPVLWVLILASIVFLPWILKAGRGQKRKLGFILMQILLLTSFFFYPAKTSFFWAAILPILILPSISAFQKFFRLIDPRARMTAIVLGFLFSGYQVITLDFQQNGLSSYQFVRDLERFVVGRQVRMFDSMGLLPRSAQIPVYVGFGDDVANSIAEKTAKINPPDIFLETSRIQSFVPRLSADLLKSGIYVEVQKGLWLKKETFGEQPSRFSEVENVSELFNQRVLWKPN